MSYTNEPDQDTKVNLYSLSDEGEIKQLVGDFSTSDSFATDGTYVAYFKDGVLCRMAL